MIVKAGKTESPTIKEGQWYKVVECRDAGYKILLNMDKHNTASFIFNDEIADYSFLDDPEYIIPIERNEPHGITGVKHSIEKAPAKPISVLLDIDIFRKASKMVMETSSHASSIHTLDSLEKEMKRQTASLCKSLKDILNNDPDYYGHCSIGTLNYRISFLWVDEDIVELDISIHPEMKDGMIVETDIESIMEQL